MGHVQFNPQRLAELATPIDKKAYKALYQMKEEIAEK